MASFPRYRRVSGAIVRSPRSAPPLADMTPPRALFVALLSLPFALLTEPACEIELECAECLPDNMPLVVSPRAGGGRVAVPAGGELALSCGAGRFVSYPLRAELRAVCERGAYRLHDGRLLPLLELGCQESVLEDVLHDVEGCAPPLQGRAYVVRAGGGAVHLATLCYDADAAVARWLRAADAPLTLPAHSERAAPLSVLGNFGRMFDLRTRLDAERLYASDERMTRRLREAFKRDRFPFAEHTLTSAKLLAGEYFPEQYAPVAEFASNRFVTWRSVAGGNLKLVHSDVARYVRARRGAGVQVFAGTRGVVSLGRAAWLAPGRFPVARYAWTALAAGGRGVALVVLNEPLVAVSAIREAVFCESQCARVGWLHSLLHARAFERPAAGLVFCCSLPDFARVVTDMPRVYNDSTPLLV